MQRSTLKPLTKQPIPSNFDQIESPVAIRVSFIRRAAVRNQRAEKNLREVRRRYELDKDRKVLFELTIAPGDYLFVE